MRKIIAVMVVTMIGLAGCAGSDVSFTDNKYVYTVHFKGKELDCVAYNRGLSCNWEAYNAAP